MKISAQAYSKFTSAHKIFSGTLERDDFRDTFRYSTFNGRATCWPYIHDGQSMPQPIWSGPSENDRYLSINVATKLVLNGSYRVNHSFSKGELILMLASVLKKSDVSEVANKIWNLAQD